MSVLFTVFYLYTCHLLVLSMTRMSPARTTTFKQAPFFFIHYVVINFILGLQVSCFCSESLPCKQTTNLPGASTHQSGFAAALPPSQPPFTPDNFFFWFSIRIILCLYNHHHGPAVPIGINAGISGWTRWSGCLKHSKEGKSNVLMRAPAGAPGRWIVHLNCSICCVYAAKHRCLNHRKDKSID